MKLSYLIMALQEAQAEFVNDPEVAVSWDLKTDLKELICINSDKDPIMLIAGR